MNANNAPVHWIACLSAYALHQSSTATIKTSFPIIACHWPWHFPGNSRTLSEIPFIPGAQNTPLIFDCWAPILWLLHDKVLRVRSPMNLVGCHPNRMKDVVTATFKKYPIFPVFWSRPPIFGQSQTFLTDMGRSRYGASNDACFVVIRPSVSEISGGGQNLPPCRLRYSGLQQGIELTRASLGILGYATRWGKGGGACRPLFLLRYPKLLERFPKFNWMFSFSILFSSHELVLSEQGMIRSLTQRSLMTSQVTRSKSKYVWRH